MILAAYLGNVVPAGDPPGFIHAVVSEEKRLGLVFVNWMIIGIPRRDIFLAILSVDAHHGEFNSVGIKLAWCERAVQQNRVGICGRASLPGDRAGRVG